jgi:hypothetical protein
MRFRERERIATIPGSVNFSNVASIPINPALAGSFPWLSGHAALFEKYCVRRLRFRYKNLKGTNSAGNVIMSFDYDTLDPAPGNAIQATQATHYIDGAPWRIFDLPVSPDKRDLFTRNGAVPGADLKTYDMGKLHISVEGCADTSDHGYLEVEYDIELFDKKPAEGVSTSVVDQFNLTANAVIAVNGIIPYDFGYRPVADSLFTNVGGVFTAKTKGTYLVCLQTVTSVTATRISVYKNGAFMVPQDVYDLPLSQYVQGSSVITLVEGDNISVHVSSATTISGNPAGFSGITLTLIG